MTKQLPKPPRAVAWIRPPIGGTLILILWQHTFDWPSWAYGVLWTLWGIVLVAVIFGLWKDSDADEISPEKWREVFK